MRKTCQSTVENTTLGLELKTCRSGIGLGNSFPCPNPCALRVALRNWTPQQIRRDRDVPKVGSSLAALEESENCDLFPRPCCLFFASATFGCYVFPNGSDPSGILNMVTAVFVPLALLDNVSKRPPQTVSSVRETAPKQFLRRGLEFFAHRGFFFDLAHDALVSVSFVVISL